MINIWINNISSKIVYFAAGEEKSISANVTILTLAEGELN